MSGAVNFQLLSRSTSGAGPVRPGPQGQEDGLMSGADS